MYEEMDEFNEYSEKVDEVAKEKDRRSNFWFYSILTLLMLAVIGFGVYRNKVFGIVLVDGESMNMTLQNGEELLMDKDVSKLERGDIIIVSLENYHLSSGTKNIIKRLIAVGGDWVKCEDGQVYLSKGCRDNYQPLDEPYAYYREDKTAYDFAEYEVKYGEIFFLGDNRFNSKDSRYKEGNSNIDKLYKETDIIGYVPTWAMEEKNQTWIKLFFLGGRSCAGKNKR